jgi:signal transduction histidine kinase
MVEDIDISKGMFNKVFDKEKPYYIEDFSLFIENSLELGVYSAIIVPLRSKDEYVGSLNIGSSIHQSLSEKEQELLLAIGKQMGIIIQKFESEQLLKKSEEKYREAYNRINLYKDLFTHDINNIFQNILSSNELAMLYSNNPEKLQDYVEVANLIKEQVSRGSKLVSNVQKLSELEDFEKPLYTLEVYSVLNTVINSTKKNFLHKKIDISVYSSENQYLIKANELLFDVFDNILINAVKHNRNPTIEIQIKISQNLVNDVNYVKIEFIDNGIGIPDIMKDVIFQRDLKKEKAGGIGLGLLLIKRILESYKGNVKVEDRVLGDYSKGSNFIVLIPKT